MIYSNDVTPIVDGKYKVYRRRYYILFLFWINAFCLGASTFFGPIAHSVKDVFQMNDGDVALLNNWSPITFLICFVPSCIILGKYGIRVPMVLFGGLTSLGVGLRCLVYWSKISQAKWIFHISQFLGGLSQPIYQMAPPAVSAIWFPPEQRNMATAITSTGIALGAGFSSLIEPIFVKEYNFSSGHENETNYQKEYKEEFHSIIYVFLGLFVFTLFFYIAIVIYFPGKPPTPTCPTQAADMGPIIPALKDLARNKDYWLLSLGVYFMFGIYYSWFSMLVITLHDLGFSQSSVGPMMFIQIIGAAITSLILGILVDWLKRRHKVLMVPSFSIGAISMIFYMLQYLDILPKSTESLFATFVFLGVFLVGALPLVMEVLAEISYPVSETIVLAVPVFLTNITNTVTLLMIPAAGVAWLSWCWLVGAICVPLSAALVKVEYKRSDFDANLYNQCPYSDELSNNNPNCDLENDTVPE